MRIREGDPLEIYTNSDGSVIFKKYSPIGELGNFAAQYADVLNRISGFPIVICDNDHVVTVAGLPKKELMERRVSQALEEITESRKTYEAKQGSVSSVIPIEGYDKPAMAVSPITASGDVYGSIIMFPNDESTGIASETEIKLLLTAAGFLSKQMEE